MESYIRKSIREFTANRVRVQIGAESTNRNKLFLSINRINVSDWFMEKFNNLSQPLQVKKEDIKNRGHKM